MLPHLLPYQKRWIEDTSQIKLMEKARQIGISWATAYSLVRKHAFYPTSLDTWVSSRDITQARLFIEDCKYFAKLFNHAASRRQLPPITPPRPSSSLILTFAPNIPITLQNTCFENGIYTQQFKNSVEEASGEAEERTHVRNEGFSPDTQQRANLKCDAYIKLDFRQTSINGISSNPNAQAGKRGTRILDEFALHPNPHQLYTIAYPGTTWGGELQIISTHRGSRNFFNTLIQEIYNGNPKKISHHRVTLQDALDQGFLKTLKSSLPPSDPRQLMDEADYFNFIRNSCPDEESFLQEYMCQPADYQSYFLSPNLVASCEYPDNDTAWNTPLHKLRLSPHDLYMGIDVGRINDFTVFWLLEVVNNVYFTRHVRSLQNSNFTTQEKLLHEFTSLPNLRRICIDATAMGYQFTERAKITFGASRVEGIHFTSPLKAILAYTVRSALENRSLFLPPDPLIRTDLLSLKRQLTHAGNIRLDTEHSSIGHADHFWALSLALHAAKSFTSTIPYYESFPRFNHNDF